MECAAGDILDACLVPAARSSGSLFEGMNDLVGSDFISHVLVLVTASHVALLAVEMTIGGPAGPLDAALAATNAAAYVVERAGRIAAVHRQTKSRSDGSGGVDLPLLSTEGVRMNRIVSSARGRLLLGGEDGNIYEVASEAHDPRIFTIKSWFSGWLSPSRPLVGWASGQCWSASAWLKKQAVNAEGERVAVVDVAIDDARQLLHALSVVAARRGAARGATCFVRTYRCDGASRNGALALLSTTVLRRDAPLAAPARRSRVFVVPRADSEHVCAAVVLSDGSVRYVDAPPRGRARGGVCAAAAAPRVVDKCSAASAPDGAWRAVGRTLIGAHYATGGIFLTATSCDTEVAEWLQSDAEGRWRAIEEEMRSGAAKWRVEGLRAIRKHAVEVGPGGAVFITLGIEADSSLERRAGQEGFGRGARRSRRGVGVGLRAAGGGGAAARAVPPRYAYLARILREVLENVLGASDSASDFEIAVTRIAPHEQQQWTAAAIATVRVRGLRARAGDAPLLHTVYPAAKLVATRPHLGAVGARGLCAVHELEIEGGMIVKGALFISCCVALFFCLLTFFCLLSSFCSH